MYVCVGVLGSPGMNKTTNMLWSLCVPTHLMSFSVQRSIYSGVSLSVQDYGLHPVWLLLNFWIYYNNNTQSREYRQYRQINGKTLSFIKNGRTKRSARELAMD